MDRRPRLDHQNGFAKRYGIFNSNITFKEKILFTLDIRSRLDYQNCFVKDMKFLIQVLHLKRKYNLFWT